MSHDQNFKNLIVDYPRESIAFFAAVEAQAVDASARIVPIREEQLKERLGERCRELDVPLLVEWPDGRRPPPEETAALSRIPRTDIPTTL